MGSEEAGLLIVFLAPRCVWRYVQIEQRVLLLCFVKLCSMQDNTTWYNFLVCSKLVVLVI